MKTVPFGAAFAALWLHGAVAFAGDLDTITPIKHVIVVVGENVSFDTLYGAYQPPRGRSIFNLLSQGIIRADGTPGANYAKAVQRLGQNRAGRYTLDLIRLNAYAKLPQPFATGELNLATLQFSPDVPDPNFAALTANGPFQITKFVPYNSRNPVGGAPQTTGDPVHRFFQMWQQTGGSNAKLDMFTWVATTVGTGGDSGVTAANPGQGGELMGFFNMSQTDAPFFKQLAQSYAISDNYHQSVMGGTGANFFSLATADAAVYQLGGALQVPPANQIENPDPQPETDNFYTRDGYSGGSYVNCSDPAQPGVAAIKAVLDAKARATNCAPGAYYLVNNYNPGFDISGNPVALGPNQFVYPPQTVPTIGEKLTAGNVSWKWYTGGRDPIDVTGDPLYPRIRALVAAQVPPGTPPAVIDALTFQQTQPIMYNNIGDPLNASANIQANPALKGNLKGLDSFYKDVAASSLPAVAFVVPKNLDSGHPGYSVPGRYEAFLQDLVQRVQSNATLYASTAILITTDEGGGYFDSGYIQNLDFFGDGTRIPLIVVSPFTTAGYVDHTYQDHVSVLKFIEHNWQLQGGLSGRSRDNLPNPVRDPNNPYKPANEPAIGDLMSLFTFPAAH
jgi:phospholipase C